MKNKTLSYYIREFLVTYLDTRRNCSYNTISSYKDTIKLFIRYNKKNSNKLDMSHLNYININNFLDYLEKERNSSINTRNQRLACIKSLCGFIMDYNPIYIEQFNPILNIKSKNQNNKLMQILTKEEIKTLLSKPNTKTKQGIKELVILTLLYDAALRISELINLKFEDVCLEKPFKIKVINSKRNKSREVPITDDTVEILKKYIEVFDIKSGDYFILSNQKKIYTSNGIRRIIEKYTKDFRFKVTPHTFRHTKASHLVESGVPLIYIRDILGHEHVETTEIYAKVNDRIKNSIILEKALPINTEIKYNIDEDEELLDWLNSL